jgi:hypothetical protein
LLFDSQLRGEISPDPGGFRWGASTNSSPPPFICMRLQVHRLISHSGPTLPPKRDINYLLLELRLHRTTASFFHSPLHWFEVKGQHQQKKESETEPKNK